MIATNLQVFVREPNLCHGGSFGARKWLGHRKSTNQMGHIMLGQLYFWALNEWITFKSMWNRTGCWLSRDKFQRGFFKFQAWPRPVQHLVGQLPTTAPMAAGLVGFGGQSELLCPKGIQLCLLRGLAWLMWLITVDSSSELEDGIGPTLAICVHIKILILPLQTEHIFWGIHVFARA